VVPETILKGSLDVKERFGLVRQGLTLGKKHQVQVELSKSRAEARMPRPALAISKESRFCWFAARLNRGEDMAGHSGLVSYKRGFAYEGYTLFSPFG